MNALTSFKSTVSRFAKDRSGNFALMFAAASAGIVLSAGFAIDVTQMLNARAELRQALDAAIVSTALDISRNKVSEADAKTRLELFFRSNLNSKRYSDAATSLTNVKVDGVTNIISASATTDYQLAFPVFGADKTKKISTSSAAQYRQRLVEVSMVLDVTGSMEKTAKSDKIGDLKIAAKAGVKAFLDTGYGNARVAIVPYAFGVNTGSLKTHVMDEAGMPIKGKCATERRGPQMFTDASPIGAKVTLGSNINYTDVNGDTFPIVFPSKTYSCPTTPLLPMTKNSATLNAEIDSLEAKGGTAGQMGIQWGWYMLSPNWKSVLPASAAPVAYGTPEVDKYLIIMTDGVFNSEASGLASVPAVPGVAKASGRLALSYCNAIKAQKIKVFTIGFKMDENGSEKAEAIKVLQDCASTPVGTETTFFNADNGAELTAAFEEIAKRVEHVALVN